VVVCGVPGVARVGTGSGQSGLAQLAAWGFNLLGPGTAAECAGRGIPHLETLEMRRAEHPLIRTGGAELPDVFDPRWGDTCRNRVAAVNAGRELAGYVSDTELGWAQPPVNGSVPVRPTLLQLCLSLDPRFAAYHAAWEFVLAPRAGEWAALNRAWGLALPNRETLRQMTQEDHVLATPGYLLDHARFTREFAQRYFRGVAAAVKAADPGRLFLGAPVSHLAPAEIRDAAVAHVDVLMTDAVAGGGGGGAMLIVGHTWLPLADAAEADEEWPLSRLERMHRRGRASLLNLIRHPHVIGYLWKTYAAGDRVDHAPFGGGLVYSDGSIAHEVVEPLAAIHKVAAAVHAGGARP
jgi:hypothetical protein